ncbi:unnamed protein product [Amoebophrya sp. A120]|nr:unnamed protein product [Amoebophrya sp. A120]|eukprot:GSA120T00025206001.1
MGCLWKAPRLAECVASRQLSLKRANRKSFRRGRRKGFRNARENPSRGFRKSFRNPSGILPKCFRNPSEILPPTVWPTLLGEREIENFFFLKKAICNAVFRPSPKARSSFWLRPSPLVSQK